MQDSCFSHDRTAVILDQHPLWLVAVESVLARLGVTVAGKATVPEEALAMLAEHQPDVLITGIRMSPGQMDGLACMREARERRPQLKTIVLSMYDDAEHIEAAFTAGAVAYVVKTAHPDDIGSAIRQAFEHSIYLAGDHAPTVAAAPAPRVADDSPALTRRELEILQLVAEGHSNAALARMLWVTEQTVKFHLSNIYRKLDVANRTEASRWAQVQGLLPGAPRVAVAIA